MDGEVFDFFLDFKRREFCRWNKIVPEYKYDRNTPYFNILVPTEDTIR